MADGERKKNEAGYALLYALGAIVLVSLIVGAIFLLARNSFLQINTVDHFKQMKDVEEYALQETSTQIKKKLEKELSKMNLTEDLGTDEQRLKGMVQAWFNQFEASAKDIGSKHQFSYQAGFGSSGISATKVLPYVLTSDSEGNGWKKSATFLDDVTNIKLVFPLEAVISETIGEKITKKTVSCEYVYEIQWNKVKVDEEYIALDVWRNVFYSYYLPNNAHYLSADEWMRKIDQIYRYQDGLQTFDYSSYSDIAGYQTGSQGGQIVDVKDGEFLNFSTGGKMIRDVTFSGSFLLENGVKMTGITGGKLKTGNLLVLKSGSNKTNYIHNTTVTANVGTYVDLQEQGRKLILSVPEFTTSNVLLNNSNTDKNSKISTEGVLFSEGILSIGKINEANSFSFANYAAEATKKNPRDNTWNEFLTGSLVVASSNFYAGPVNEGTDINSNTKTKRHISVNGNFMLTNAKLSSEKGEAGFSYFQDSNAFTYPNTASKITLDGSDTKLTVAGRSFIDSPKTERRKSASETGGTEKYTGFYGDKDYWNQITVKNGAVIELGYTGVEPFNLNIQKKSYLSLKTLPDLELFDTDFIRYCVSRGQLEGKLIIQPFNQKDATALEEELKSSNIPVTTVTNYGDATDSLKTEDGQVVIVKPVNTSGKESSIVISRTFDYVESINY